MSMNLKSSLAKTSVAVITALAVSAGVVPASALAQVNLQLQVVAPIIRFETAPVLVEVSPGVQVVPEYEEEVFFVDGWYWSRSGRAWYRTRDHHGGWVVVQRSAVPSTIVMVPPGKYRHYKARGPKFKERQRHGGGGGEGPRFKHHHHKHKKHKHK